VWAAAQAHRWKEAYEAWDSYFATRDTPPHLVEVTGERPAPATIHDAERLVRHEIQGWHNLTYTFGAQVDFNADWGRSGKYGMHYWDWSESLRLAFIQTDDRRYARCFDDLFNQWYTQRDSIDNPIPHLDVIFYELGLGIRTPHFIDHYFAYRGISVLPWRTQARLLKTILGACRWLSLLEQEGYRQGNWQMCGAWALVYAGALLPEFLEAQDWLAIGVQRLLEHIDQDFYADGGHSERAAGYGAWCTRLSADLLRFSVWYPRIKVPDALRDRVLQMYDWFLATVTPLGEVPGVNDSGFDMQDALFRQAALDTGDGRFLWPVRRRLRSVNDVRPKLPTFHSIDLRPSGFAVMRSGWDRNAHYLLLNYGPWGGSHTHNALLDFALYAFGAPVAIEATRWGPYDNPLDHYFRSPQAHNQVVVNDAPLDRVNCQGEQVVWVAGQGLDYFSAQHQGYAPAFGVTIQRQVLFLKPDYFLVSDTIFEGPQHQSYTWYLHSPYKWQVGQTRCLTMARPGLQVVPAQPTEIRHIRQGTAYEARDGAPEPYANRYWIGLQKWIASEGEAVVIYDIALVPFRHTPSPVKVFQIPVRIDGRHARPEIARGIRVVRGQRRYPREV
jgi:hypothetical protein